MNMFIHDEQISFHGTQNIIDELIDLATDRKSVSCDMFQVTFTFDQVAPVPYHLVTAMASISTNAPAGNFAA